MNYHDLDAAMAACEQSSGYSVLQHGVDVCEHFYRLTHTPLGDLWKLPSWYIDYGQQITAVTHQDAVWRLYTTYHDCGKPACRTVDAEGKVHFPDHAAVSSRVWLDAGGDPTVAKLIAADMTIHTMSAADIPQFCETHGVADVVTLLVTALAEIHSNSRMFGGIKSTSFLSKWTQVDRRGKAICKHLFPAGR